MILADTSVWVEHFRRGSDALAARLDHGEVATHTVVIGELATGNLRQRQQTLALLQALPRLREGTSAECLRYLAHHQLYGRGIGWNDIQLLVSAELSRVPLWSGDRPLAAIAGKLGLLFDFR
jgi:predicted nucleic acid-binding protein